MENKNCQSCKKDFTIEAEDFDFYTKINVPPPTLCPDCRQHRRYAWRNERTLYRRSCDLCQKSMVTIYSPDKPFKVYCLPCWWGDGWDSAIYGKDFDFSRPFFEQFSELQHEVPRMALLTKNSVNSDYTNHCGDNKNVYLSFSSFGDENVFYSTWVMNSRDTMDCLCIFEAGERCYECMDVRKSYRCQFGSLLKDCADCLYCYDCHGCSNCFLSSNLRNKSYMFMNKQCTREEYLEKVAEYDLASHAVRESLYEKWLDLMLTKSIHRYVVSERNVNATGSMLFGSKNAHACFDADVIEDSKYMFSSKTTKTSMDLYQVGINTEMAYECQGCTRIYNSQFCHLCYDNAHIMYSDTCQNSQNLFGCVSVKKGEYQIFNKIYTKEEYLALKEKIIEHMKRTGEYGEFFPPSIAPVYYNETQGQYYVPMTKEQVLAKDWHWQDHMPGTYGKETVLPDAIPDLITDVADDATKQVFRCSDCTKNYNIVSDELTFYRRESIPLTRRCPDCRYKRRFVLRPPQKLWHRTCMHEGCSNEFETSYAPDRQEVIYCESCYQKEVL